MPESRPIDRSVPCPECGARVGEKCVTRYGTRTRHVHDIRLSPYAQRRQWEDHLPSESGTDVSRDTPPDAQRVVGPVGAVGRIPDKES